MTDFSADRAAGVLVGCACGDALGAGYEFGHVPADIGMIGGGLGGFAPGEWTDDTSMAICIAEVAAQGVDLRSGAGLDAVAAGFRRWYQSPPADIGILTSSVLSAAGAADGEGLTKAAQRIYDSGRPTAGNGSLMRTAAVALNHLDDPVAAADAARAVSDLTHADPVAAEACVIWTLGIRHAVLTGTFDGVREGLRFLSPDRAQVWSAWLDEAQAHEPSYFARNGWVVQALQAAWSAITRTPVPSTYPAQHFADAVEAAVRAGHDTDTVAAIAGSLLGARWGVSAIPLEWKRMLNGYPDYRARELVRLGVQAGRLSLGLGADDSQGWPGGALLPYGGLGNGPIVAHPHDAGVLLGGIDGLRDLPKEVDAVVSLCRLGAAEVPAPGIDPDDHIEVWLIDSNDPATNPHLAFVIDQAARAVAALRAEGKTVYLHCVEARSRTPSVAARYAVIARGVEPRQALAEVCAALPKAVPQRALAEAVLLLQP
jgi:ADP-ribosylglycohydrolase